MPDDHVLRRNSGVLTGPFLARRIPGGVSGPGGDDDLIEIADVTGLQTALDGKAGATHSHIIADVTGLQTALNGKAATTHTHTPASLGAAEVLSSAWPGFLRIVGNSTAWHVPASFLVPTPTGISATAGAGEITVTWTDLGADSFDIYRSETNVFGDAVLLANVDGGTYTDTTPTVGVTYYYWVIGRIEDGFSEPPEPRSNVAT
jgi:hypothetical protein